MKIVCVGATFNGSNLYHYAVPEDESSEPAVGDFIITSAQRLDEDVRIEQRFEDPSSSIKIASVSQVLFDMAPKATRTYLMLVPRDLMIRRRASQQEAVAKFKKKQEALRKLRSMVEEQAMEQVMRQLAATSPEAKTLYDIAFG